MKRILSALAALCVICALIFRQESLLGAKIGLQLCQSVLIPAVLPFAAICSLYAECGICTYLGKLFSPLSKRLLNVGKTGAGILFLSFVCPLPSPCLALGKAYRNGEISKNDAELLCGCTNGLSPSLMIGLAGVGALGSVKLGVLICACNAASSLIYCFCIRDRMDGIERCRRREPEVSPACLVNAVKNGIKACGLACGATVLFSALKEMLCAMRINIPPQLLIFADPITGMLTANGAFSSFSADVSFALLNASISLTGVWGCLQLYDACRKNGLSVRRCIYGKISQSLINFCISLALYRIFLK